MRFNNLIKKDSEKYPALWPDIFLISLKQNIKLSWWIFLNMIQQQIKSLIDFFYPPFKRLMPLNTFRYAACGGVNVALDIGLFFIFYNFVYHKQIVHLNLFSFQPHIAAFLSSFLITFPIGFLLSKYIVWTSSKVKGHVQLFRYFVIVMLDFLLNYVFLKLFVEYFHIYPTISKMMTTAIVIIFSYLSQKHYTFKVSLNNHLKEIDT